MPNDCYTRQNLKEAKMCAFKTIGKIQYPSCPQCGKIGSHTSGITLSPLIELINHIYNGHEILNFRPGPVLQYCDKCGTVYFNPANTEVALSGTRNRIAVLSGFWFMLFAIITGYIIQSMSRKGNCYDNSIMENFFGKMKNEMFYGHEYEFNTLDELKDAMEKYIHYYNNDRIQKKLKGRTPCEVRNSTLE